MKEYLWCTPEITRDPYQQRGNSQFIFLKLREVQGNVVHVIIQHTADHKRYDDSRKCTTSVLGDKVSKKCPVCFSTTRKPFFFIFTAFNHSSCILYFLSFLTWCDIVLTKFTGVSVSYSSQAVEEHWMKNEFPSGKTIALATTQGLNILTEQAVTKNVKYFPIGMLARGPLWR